MDAKSAKNRLNAGIVGLGKMGHVRADVIAKHPALVLSAICDVANDRLMPAYLR